MLAAPLLALGQAAHGEAAGAPAGDPNLSHPTRVISNAGSLHRTMYDDVIVGAHTQAATVMIAEKAADMMAETDGHRA